MQPIYRRVVLVIILGMACSAVAGCAAHEARYRQGLQWHLDTEAQKRQLHQQGFPQYWD